MEIQTIDDTPDETAVNATDSRSEVPSGAIHGVHAPSKLNNKKLGEWNHMHLTVLGRRVIVEINGLRVIDHELNADDLAMRPELGRTTGRIGLQSYRGRVEFHNVFVKRIVRSEAK
jgi:hypothetical protein